MLLFPTTPDLELITKIPEKGSDDSKSEPAEENGNQERRMCRVTFRFAADGTSVGSIQKAHVAGDAGPGVCGKSDKGVTCPPSTARRRRCGTAFPPNVTGSLTDSSVRHSSHLGHISPSFPD